MSTVLKACIEQSEEYTSQELKDYDQIGDEITRARLGWYISKAYQTGFGNGGRLVLGMFSKEIQAPHNKQENES